jgi:16S rRNA A1518/A1519 N6-dimethyltransferase RsmA/KsgA/DIM1 with predicted DNA glycosylase/AP lyase activity
VRLRFREPRHHPRSVELFARLVQAVFTRRRKTLENALMAFQTWDRAAISRVLRHADIDGRRRPETLDVAELVRLADAVEPLPDGPGAML